MKEMKNDLLRRDFVKTMAVGIGVTAVSGVNTRGSRAQDKPLDWDREADVVVVGYGGAGVVAAITAHDAGAKVLVLEKSPSLASVGVTDGPYPALQISGGGGNTHISMGQFTSPTNADDAAAYLYAACGGLAPGGSLTPKEVCQAWAEELCKNKAWADQMGIPNTVIPNRRAEFPNLPGYDAMTVCQTTGYGQVWFKTLDKHVQDRGIEVLFDSPATELIQNPNTKEILGVKAKSGAGGKNMRARRGVVLCTGGFEFNEGMKNDFLKCYPMKFFGWGYNTGDGIKMAQKVGADLWHMDNLCGWKCAWFPDDPINVGRSADVRTSNFIYVDRFGRRYCNERDPLINHHKGWVAFSEFSLAEGGYSRIPTYLIFDETARNAGPLNSFGQSMTPPYTPFTMGRVLLPPELGGTAPWSHDNSAEVARGWIKKGDTVEALAAAIGEKVDPALLKASVETYNGYCSAGKDQEFKRNPETLKPVETPPYYAVPIYPGLDSTTGGPRRNGKGQVLDPDKKPIPRLYSAGSFGSVYGLIYSVTGGNIGELMAFGRISGRNVAAEEPWS